MKKLPKDTKKTDSARATTHQNMGISGRDKPRTKTTESPFLTTAEAAEFLRISEPALRVRVMRQQITAYKDGRRLLFKKQELVRVVEKSRIGYEFGF